MESVAHYWSPFSLLTYLLHASNLSVRITDSEEEKDRRTGKQWEIGSKKRSKKRSRKGEGGMRERGGRGTGDGVLKGLRGEKSTRKIYRSRVETSITGNKHAKVRY